MTIKEFFSNYDELLEHYKTLYVFNKKLDGLILSEDDYKVLIASSSKDLIETQNRNMKNLEMMELFSKAREV